MGVIRSDKLQPLPFANPAQGRALPKARYEFTAPGRFTLVPVTGLAFLPEKQAKSMSQQILFPL